MLQGAQCLTSLSSSLLYFFLSLPSFSFTLFEIEVVNQHNVSKMLSDLLLGGVAVLNGLYLYLTIVFIFKGGVENKRNAQRSQQMLLLE